MSDRLPPDPGASPGEHFAPGSRLSGAMLGGAVVGANIRRPAAQLLTAEPGVRPLARSAPCSYGGAMLRGFRVANPHPVPMLIELEHDAGAEPLELEPLGWAELELEPVLVAPLEPLLVRLRLLRVRGTEGTEAALRELAGVGGPPLEALAVWAVLEVP